MALINEDLVQNLDEAISSLPNCEQEKKHVLVKYRRLCNDILSDSLSPVEKTYSLKKGTFFIIDTAEALEIYLFTNLFGQINRDLLKLGIQGFSGDLWSTINTLKRGDTYEFKNKIFQIVYRTRSIKPPKQKPQKAPNKKKKKSSKNMDEDKYVYPIVDQSSGYTAFRTGLRKYPKRSKGNFLVRVNI